MEPVSFFKRVFCVLEEVYLPAIKFYLYLLQRKYCVYEIWDKDTDK